MGPNFVDIDLFRDNNGFDTEKKWCTPRTVLFYINFSIKCDKILKIERKNPNRLLHRS